MANEYKYFENKYIDDIQANYFKPILDDVFADHAENVKKMADIGCGNGIFTAYLKKTRNIKLYGFDASEYALECALRNGFDKVILSKDFSAEPLQAEPGVFDLIFNKDVLEHLMDPEFLIKEIARTLKFDGLFLLHIPNDFNLCKRIKFIFSNNVDTYNYFPDAKEWNRPHIRFFTYGGIKELLRLHGFEIVKNYSSFFAHFPLMPLVHRIPGYKAMGRCLADKFPSQFSQAITVLARRKPPVGTSI